MQHIIVHGKNNLYSDLYLIILMIALELCWWWLLIEHSLCPRRHLYIPLCPPASPLLLFPCVPVVICVPVSSVCNFSLSVLVVIYIPCVPVVICVPVLCWWWLLIEHSLCPGRFLFECPGRHLYSLCPGVPVVICVPMSRSVISSVDKHWCQSTHKHDVTRQTHRQLIFIYTDFL